MTDPVESQSIRHARRAPKVAWGALLVLTALALVPYDPHQPIDGATSQAYDGAEASFPLAGALLEPVAALGHVIAGAPDFRSAAISILVWALVLGFAVPMIRWRAAGRRTSAVRATGIAALVAGGCVFAVVINIGFLLLTPVPTWRLDATAPDTVLVDLQSHTLWSHDGLATVEHSLDWHRARGFDVVAVTEHDNLRGAAEAWMVASERPDAPAVLSGMEIRREGYLMVLGGSYVDWTPPETPEAAVAAAHERGMAVTCLPWRMDVDEIHRVAAAGVDGFEIVNAGHPDLPPDVRDAILEETRERGLVSVASTDWHGWAGFCRAWTAVRLPGWRDLSRDELTTRITEKLKRRDARDFTAISLGSMGVPSPMRRVFAPIVEVARYCMELTPSRVVAWWLWILGLSAVARRMHRADIDASLLLTGAFAALLSSVVLLQATRLVTTSALLGATSELAPEVAAYSTAAALAGLAAGAALIWRATARRGAA